MKRFLLIDDHAIVRSGVKYMLEQFFSPEVVDEASNEPEVIKKIRSKPYDLILLDVNIPNTNTSDLLKFILITQPASKVLMFSMNAEKIHAKRYLEAGAMGFLSKDAPIDEIKRAINCVLSNRKYYSQDLINSIVDDKHTTAGNPINNLTEREFEIFQLILEGKTITEISSILNIQRSTVGTHKSKIFEKLNDNNIIEPIDLSKIYR